MNDLLVNNLSMIIIGDQTNKKFDGVFKIKGIKDGCIYHIDAINKIINDLNTEGYCIKNIDTNDTFEKGFYLISNGHILFGNFTENHKKKAGYLLIPNHMTEKEIISLRLFENQLQKFDTLYIEKKDDYDDESFDPIELDGKFTVNKLLKKSYKKIG